MSKDEKHFQQLVSRYAELQRTRGLSDAELALVTAWMQDIIQTMARHSEIAANNFGPRWEHIQLATLEMFRWFVDFESHIHE